MDDIFVAEREVIKEVMEFGSVRKMMGKGLRYVEIFHDGISQEFVWGNNRVLGLFVSFEQFTDYIFGGKKGDEDLYYFYKENGEPYSPRGYHDWQIVRKDEIQKKWHPHLQGSNDVLLAQDMDDWVFIFPDGSIFEDGEVWA